MPLNKNWIDEQQEAIEMYRGISGASDALKLLEHSDTNRDISSEQARLGAISRHMFSVTGVTTYRDLPVLCEKAQMNIDNRARQDYMKVAIEQWQSKLQSKKGTVQALL